MTFFLKDEKVIDKQSTYPPKMHIQTVACVLDLLTV